MSDSIRVFVADDHLMVRSGLISLIQGFPELALAGEASSGEHAIDLYRQIQPDVVLMDMSMPGMGGIEAISVICAEYPQAKIIALTSFQDKFLVKQAIDAGARGFLYKDVSVADLVDAIRQVYAGKVTLEPQALEALMKSSGQPMNVPKIHLTPRENDILRLLVEGKSNKEMAAALHIQPSTVKQALSGIFLKLGAHNRAEAVSITMRLKIHS
jgi:two-component system NarL family response regulator